MMDNDNSLIHIHYADQTTLTKTLASDTHAATIFRGGRDTLSEQKEYIRPYYTKAIQSLKLPSNSDDS